MKDYEHNQFFDIKRVPGLVLLRQGETVRGAAKIASTPTNRFEIGQRKQLMIFSHQNTG